MNRATESICPKGWTIPNNTQIKSVQANDSGIYIPTFSPVLGGFYANIAMNREFTNGYWWSSEAQNTGRRYSLNYNGTNIYLADSNSRFNGFYIRCVAKQKTITDLAYMQDVGFFLDFSEW